MLALEKESKEWQMFGDYFVLCKKYWDVKDTEKYMEDLIISVNEFYEKYKDIPLSEGLSIAFSETQDKLFKKNKKD